MSLFSRIAFPAAVMAIATAGALDYGRGPVQPLRTSEGVRVAAPDTVIYPVAGYKLRRTLSLEEYNGITAVDNFCTFSCYFMTNREESATTVWVANDFFYLGSVSFTNSSKDGGNIDLGDNLNNGGKL